MNIDKKVAQIESSYSTSFKGVKDKTLFMLKKELSPLMLGFIKEDDWNTEIMSDEGAFELMATRVESILDAVTEPGRVKAERPFEYPVVLSFLASYSLGKCTVPNGYLSQFEFERIQFASTGLTV